LTELRARRLTFGAATAHANQQIEHGALEGVGGLSTQAVASPRGSLR
jgi:hypothetical protein